MTDSPEVETEQQRREIAAAFDKPLDPLRGAGEVFDSVEVDPFELFKSDVLDRRGLAESTYSHYELVFDQWRDHMAAMGRHPACPNPDHVEAFIEWQRTPEADGGPGNVNRTVKEKLRKLNHAFRYWQTESIFPHPNGYNPIDIALERVSLPVRKKKEHRRIPLPELREMVASVKNLRARAIIVAQLKLGLRAGELRNVKVGDLRMTDSESSKYLDEMGSNPGLGDHDAGIYIPSRDERDGNKSVRPRLLPIDEELLSLLDRHLIVRPDYGEPWLFLSLKSHSQMTSKGVNKVWKDAVHPEYAETDQHRPVTSHFGRHRFTTYWRVEQDLNRQLVKYMRGDRTGAYENARGIDAYLHAYYEDIESVYRENIYSVV